MTKEVQLSLLDIGPGVRNSDPDTSRKAANRHDVGRDTDRAKALLCHYDKRIDGLTDYELADLMGRQQNSAGKRRTELRDSGMVEDTGMRRPAPSGSPCIVWRITSFGIALAEGMQK
jgi:hypothetical protein